MTETLTAPSREEEVTAGREATMLLESPLLQSTLAAMKAAEQRRWWHSAEDDTDTREAAFRMLRSIDDFEKTLTSVVTSGNLATLQLQADELEADEQQGFTSPNERRTRL